MTASELQNLDLHELKLRISKGQRFSYLMFWGHRSSPDGRITKTCLSQWFESPFELNGEIYQTSEHWMMASKARLFGDHEVSIQILKASDPQTVKELGRAVKNFDDRVWKANRRRLVTEGNIAKFEQNEKLKSFLLSTCGIVLVEASPVDSIWGIGLIADDERAKDPMMWQGENLLGFALMDVREKLLRSLTEG
jgi:ribA/ribD-fused uncharacterized protein